MTYEHERRIAELAVQRACLLTKKVFHEKAKGTLAKDDKSPVTKGDFGAQALIIQAIAKNFPNDEIVAEEESSELRQDAALRAEIWDLVKDIKLNDAASDEVIGGSLANEEAMLAVIDQGNHLVEQRVGFGLWTLLTAPRASSRGGQYAVAWPDDEWDGDAWKVGVVGCLNLPIDDSEALTTNIGSEQSDEEGKGVLFSAVQGEGAVSRPLTNAGLAPSKPISHAPSSDVSQAVFYEGVEAAHSNRDDNASVAKRLGITAPSVRLDSQAKYCSIARGAGDIYLRLPMKKDYQEKDLGPCCW